MGAVIDVLKGDGRSVLCGCLASQRREFGDIEQRGGVGFIILFLKCGVVVEIVSRFLFLPFRSLFCLCPLSCPVSLNLMSGNLRQDRGDESWLGMR